MRIRCEPEGIVLIAETTEDSEYLATLGFVDGATANITKAHVADGSPCGHVKLVATSISRKDQDERRVDMGTRADNFKHLGGPHIGGA